jgi:D-apionolactonase
VRSAADAELHAGDLTAALEGPDLVDVRWGGSDVASRIQVTVRDPEWGTVPPALVDRRIDRTDGGFRVEIDASHADDAIAFSWHGSIDANRDGELTFAIDGRAEHDFDYRRIGICVLHPRRTYVGARYEATTEAGPVHGTFPRAIAPQLRHGDTFLPMIPAFTDLAVRFPDEVVAKLAFEGELFELEDQRNWTDPSFKTYPTPLEHSEPRTMRAGNRVTQRVTLRLEGAPPAIARVREPVGTIVLRLLGPAGRRMPDVGTSATVGRFADPAHLRVEVAAGRRTPAAIIDAAASGVPLEVALLVNEERDDVRWLEPVLADVPVARVLVHLANGDTTPSAVVHAIRAQLEAVTGAAPFVGGTASGFSELNREPPDGGDVDAIAFAISPDVHATDERSLTGTLEVQAQVVGQARALGRGVPVVVSPVRMAAHEGMPFADAWTIGSLAALAGAEVASITCDTSARALATVAELRGRELAEVSVSHPDRIAALATRDASDPRGSITMVVANLTPSLQAFRLGEEAQPPMGPYEVRTLYGDAASW